MYNFYIDKKLNNPNDNFVDIKLEYPLICDETTEHFKIKLIDFSYLNNQFNISSELENNIISFQKTPIQKQIILTDIPNTYDFSSLIANDIFSENATIEYTMSSTSITGNNFVVYYIDNFTTEGVNNFKNIFNGNEKLTMINNNKYFIVGSINNLFLLKRISIGIYFNGTLLTTDANFTLRIEGSNDNFFYTNINYIIPFDFDIKFFTGENTETTKYLYNLELSNGTPYRYYRFKLFNTLTGDNVDFIDNFKLSLLTLNYAPYNYVDVELEPFIYEKVIPDGFYNATTYIAKINDILLYDKISLKLDNLTNKLIFTNTNTTPDYDYSPIDYNGVIKLYVKNNNQKNNLGILNDYSLISRETPFICDNNINLVNFSKLILSTDLIFQNKTHNDLINGNSKSTGIGNILCWLPNDSIPYTYINYVNYNNIEYIINDNFITNITINFYNELKQKININNALLHLQIIKEKK